MVAMKYGTIPVVRAVGGLDDTIIAYPNEYANGFKFLNYDAYSMVNELKNAVWTYHDRKDDWNLLTKNALQARFTWNDSATKYRGVYDELASWG
jgi:starch synthase